MPVTDATATVSIVDGRVAMSADGDVTLTLDTPRAPPLSADERYATLGINGDDYRANVDLSLGAVTELFTALKNVNDPIPDDVDPDESSDGAPSVGATDEFVWNCRDCGFVGTWLTVEGTCPKCGGRDLPTQPREGDV